MANAKQLYLEGGIPANQFYCSECRHVRGADQDFAERCCRCIYCQEIIPRESIGKGNYSSYHDKCWKDDQANREIARQEKAEKLEPGDYDGPVFIDGFTVGGWGDGFFSDLGEFMDYYDEADDDDRGNRPEFAWTCKPSKSAQIDLSSVLENLCEEMYEDAETHLTGVDELQAAVDAFNEKNKSVITWEPDNKRMVRLPWSAEHHTTSEQEQANG